jgi:hypothetical protein
MSAGRGPQEHLVNIGSAHGLLLGASGKSARAYNLASSDQRAGLHRVGENPVAAVDPILSFILSSRDGVSAFKLRRKRTINSCVKRLTPGIQEHVARIR